MHKWVGRNKEAPIDLIWPLPGADLGGGRGALLADAFSSGIRPPTDPKGPPFDTF